MSYFSDAPKAPSKKSTREQILDWKQEIDKMKTGEMRSLVEKKNSISKEITMLFTKLQNKLYKDIEEFNTISARIDTLNEQSKTITATYEKRMSKHFSEFSLKYPSIYRMFLEDEVDMETLNHVLNTFDQMERGQISQEQGTSRGLDFVTNKFNLPHDFFDKNAIGKDRRHGS